MGTNSPSGNRGLSTAAGQRWEEMVQRAALHIDVVDLAEYVEGVLPAEKQQSVVEHLAGCLECQQLEKESREITEPVTLAEIQDIIERRKREQT